MRTILMILFLFVSGLCFSNSITDTINDVDVIFSQGNEYIILKNDTYITYIIRDLKTLKQIKKDYAYIYEAYTVQQTYITELEGKVDDADKLISSMKAEMLLLSDKNSMYEQITKTLYTEHGMMAEKITKLDTRLGRISTLLKGSAILNAVLLLIIII